MVARQVVCMDCLEVLFRAEWPASQVKAHRQALKDARKAKPRPCHRCGGTGVMKVWAAGQGDPLRVTCRCRMPA